MSGTSNVAMTTYQKHLPTGTAALLKPPSSSSAEQHRRWNLFRTLGHTLDRVNVLADDDLHGHTGCVNALSWAQDGNLLISAGDDTTVRLWKMDSSHIEQEYPFVCPAVINTGHQANIFNAKMLPHSSRIITASADMQIRVFDAKTALTSATPDRVETEYSSNQTRIATIRCHRDAVKRVVTEDSPDLFMSVSEDGTVRQHDLRTPHNCRTESCSAPLVELGHELSTISLSPLTPHQFVVAGEAPYGYLFDRRHLRRTIESDWGTMPNAGKEATTCVRKFGRRSRPTNNRRIVRDHITGARMSDSNGHEVLLSYSGDGVYLYSTKDDPESRDDLSSSPPSVLPSNAGNDTPRSEPAQVNGSSPSRTYGIVTSLLDEFSSLHTPEESQPNVPVVMPRRRYAGARNVATIKDVNFLGPDDEWVVSGSDDGNFFIWNKDSGDLHGIYEGDSSVVNVVEGHPHFPLVAVSGIDTTVKLFAPTPSRSSFSRMDNAEQIMETNKRLGSTRLMRTNLAALQILADVRSAMDHEEIRPPECTGQ
ncbi:WD40-repeat-containing domain protein [Flammula alnicola]|nr:WD40-repeat-containing domain protein [Flammula alnicola]